MTSNGERRPLGDASLGSAPFHLLSRETAAAGSSELSKAQAGPQSLSLQFNPADFLQYVQDEGLTEAEAKVLLRAIWDIVVAFVDLGFGLNPVQQALVDRSLCDQESASSHSRRRVSSRDEFTKTVTRTHAARRGAAASKEDS
jgi:hypothetical protein